MALWQSLRDMSVPVDTGLIMARKRNQMRFIQSLALGGGPASTLIAKATRLEIDVFIAADSMEDYNFWCRVNAESIANANYPATDGGAGDNRFSTRHVAGAEPFKALEDAVGSALPPLPSTSSPPSSPSPSLDPGDILSGTDREELEGEGSMPRSGAGAKAGRRPIRVSVRLVSLREQTQPQMMSGANIALAAPMHPAQEAGAPANSGMLDTPQANQSPSRHTIDVDEEEFAYEDDKGDEDYVDAGKGARIPSVKRKRRSRGRRSKRKRPSAPANNGPTPSARKRRKDVCHCKHSHCLKLYCICFAKGAMCTAGLCTCVGCENDEAHQEKRKQEMAKRLKRDEAAFVPKTERKTGICKCKRSRCLKLYCECFAARRACTDDCRCQRCRNRGA